MFQFVEHWFLLADSLDPLCDQISEVINLKKLITLITLNIFMFCL